MTRAFREAEIKRFSDLLRTGRRPDTFEEAYQMTGVFCCGQYECEGRALWTILRNDGKIYRMVEVGRNFGGGLFLMCCAAQHLQYVFSMDVKPIPEIDAALSEWMDKNNIHHDIITANSLDYTHPENERYDFVYIDGGHTSDCVRADIHNFGNKTRLIGFHDFADHGKKNKHKLVFPGVVEEVCFARDARGWSQTGARGRSDVVFEVPKR